MPRANRISPGGMVFHVLNRGVGRQRLFDKPADYAAFESIIEETLEKQSIRICSYCLMPNHWHFVLWPEHDGDLAAFMQRLTVTHVTRWQNHRHRVGEGHVYLGRFKSFPVESDDYFDQVVRYVERNALRAGLVSQAEEWQCVGARIFVNPRASPVQVKIAPLHVTTKEATFTSQVMSLVDAFLGRDPRRTNTSCQNGAGLSI